MHELKAAGHTNIYITFVNFLMVCIIHIIVELMSLI